MKQRVMCLYRVSTKAQVNPENDLPMQRRECLDFISAHENWEFCGEMLEKGVSGYKLSANKRDKLLEIKAMAERKQFDVLLVFMADRLGRREDETPFLIRWFVQQGIEVWSTREGQLKADTRNDMLTLFIQSWMAGGESEKIGMRVKAIQTQMTTDGIWRGGTKPFGYKLVNNGRRGKKNRVLYDLAVDETEGPIVTELFELVANDGYGILRAANEMNRRHPDVKKAWTAASVRTILHNVTYTGRLHMNNLQSEPIESLRLVTDETFEFVQRSLQARIQRRYPTERKVEDDSLPDDAPSKAAVYGATMLAGLLYCAHCGCRLVGGYCTKQRGGEAYHRPIYRDYNRAMNSKACAGQTVYSGKRLDEAVTEIAHTYFSGLRETVDSAWEERARKHLRTDRDTAVKAAEQELEHLRKREANLRNEVILSISGESAFDKDLLQSLLTEVGEEIRHAQEKLARCEDERDTASEQIMLHHKPSTGRMRVSLSHILWKKPQCGMISAEIRISGKDVCRWKSSSRRKR